MSEFHITREYPHPVTKLWHALTDPELVPRREAGRLLS